MAITYVAWLVCDKEKTYKKHSFCGVEQAVPQTDGFNILFECNSCKESRVWGNTEILSMDLKKALKTLKN